MGQNDGASGSGRGVTQVATYPEEDKKMDCIPDGAFESTADREDRLAVREFPKRERPLDGKPDWVIMKEVEKDMTDMKNDVGDDQVQADIKKCLEGLARNTVMSDGKARPPSERLSAHRICQIENRLENDESL